MKPARVSAVDHDAAAEIEASYPDVITKSGQGAPHLAAPAHS